MPPRKKQITEPTPVDAITHPDKRTNLPTADAHDLVSPAVEEIPTVRYPRDPSLDPQLVWRGKDEQDSSDLEVAAPPIFIQEKVVPRVLIENLRDTADSTKEEPELSLFESFDGLDELEIVEFYEHEANWSNRMILGDSLQVMTSLAEREGLRGQVQAIYVDPPYGIKFGSNWQMSARKTGVKDGKPDDLTREAEALRAFRDTWELGINSYLSYLRDRLMAARELLTSTGSLFLQISDDNVHLARSVLDEVFGAENFCSEIVFRKTSGASTTVLASTVDFILWYAKDKAQAKYRQLFRPKISGGAGASTYARIELQDGTRRSATSAERTAPPPGARLFAAGEITSQTPAPTTSYSYEFEGVSYSPGRRGWATTREGMERLDAARRLTVSGNTLRYVRFLDDFPAFPLTNSWEDTGVGSFTESKIYVVQTNTKVVERCLLMASDPGDLVLDPTCGSGTTAAMSEKWGRRWITIDSSRVALALARQRLMGSRFPYFILADSEEGRQIASEEYGADDVPGSPANDIRLGFMCKQAPHITLGSIARNPDIRPGMSREEIDAAIKRHAESEPLLDQPFEDAKKVRVSGPFTIESLSPHRAFATPDAGQRTSTGITTQEDGAFRERILENLRAAGIQNGIRAERLLFSNLEDYAGTRVHATGSAGAAEGEETEFEVAVSIGPEYGTVGAAFIKEAAREAIAAGDTELLCILGFSFDANVAAQDDEIEVSDEGFDVAAERSLGRLRVLLVRMNTDLLGGEDLKKTASANLFMVFGQPDIDIAVDGDSASVALRGVDVYDPVADEIRSDATDHIALWMIDTNYNGESFFVRHCYFTGGIDPYKRLKTALKADIDEEAWASLYRTESRPFPLPETGKIAVKVINDYGDEVMQVFDVPSSS